MEPIEHVFKSKRSPSHLGDGPRALVRVRWLHCLILSCVTFDPRMRCRRGNKPVEWRGTLLRATQSHYPLFSSVLQGLCSPHVSVPLSRSLFGFFKVRSKVRHFVGKPVFAGRTGISCAANDDFAFFLCFVSSSFSERFPSTPPQSRRDSATATGLSHSCPPYLTYLR